MQVADLKNYLSSNEYPGRGVLIGKSEDGKNAVIVYFIMGRSENSRNRVFVTEDEGIRTQAFDPAKLSDPSLIIYSPVRVLGSKTVVTNGDQTDTVYDFLKEGKPLRKLSEHVPLSPMSLTLPPEFQVKQILQTASFSISFQSSKAQTAIPKA